MAFETVLSIASTMLFLISGVLAFLLGQRGNSTWAWGTVAVAMGGLAAWRIFSIRQLTPSDGLNELTAFTSAAFLLAGGLAWLLRSSGGGLDESVDQKRYRVLAESTMFGVAISEGGRFREVSDRFAEMFGYRPAELIGTSASELIAPKAREDAMVKILSGYDRTYTSVCQRKDGSTFPVEVSGRNYLENGRGLRLTAIREISSETSTEDAYREIDVLYRTLIDTSPDGVMVVDLEGQVQMASNAALELYGFADPEEVVGTSAFDLLDPADHTRANAILERTLKKGVIRNEEYTFLRQDGTAFLGELSISLFRDGAGEPRGFIATIRDTTRRKFTEEEIRSSESRYRSLFEDSAISLWLEDWSEVRSFLEALHSQDVSDLAGYLDQHPEATTECMRRIEVLDVNNATLELHHAKDKDELLAGLQHILPDEGIQLFKDELIAVAEGRLPFEYETVHFTQDGDRKDILLRIQVPEGYEDSLSRVFVSMIDITGRVAAENMLQESEEKFRNLAEQSPNMIFINQMGRVVFANPKCEELMGYTRDEFTSPEFDFLTLIAPASQELIQQNFARHSSGLDLPPFEYSLLTRSGEPLEVIITTRLITYEGENAILGFVTDITERKRYETALRESEQLFRLLAENAKECIYRASILPERRFEYVSPMATQINGYTVEEHYADPDMVAKLIHPEDQGILQNWLQGPSAFEGTRQIRWIHKDGRLVWTEQTTTPIYSKEGALIAVEGIVRDITERRRVEDEIRRLNEFNENILQSMSEGVMVDDVNGYFTFVNQAAAEMLGYATEELHGKHWKAVFPEEQLGLVYEANETRALGEASRYEIDFLRKDGSRFPTILSGSPLLDKGELTGTMAVFMDITQRKLWEREQNAIVAVSTALRAASDRVEMLPIILDQLLSLLEASGAALAVKVLPGGKTRIELAQGDWSEWTGEELEPNVGVAGWVIASGERYLSESISIDPLFAHPELLAGLDALICVPLIAQSETIGALLVGRRKPFNEGEVRISTAIADMAANALRRAHLMETLEERVRERTLDLEQANLRLQELDKLKSDFVSNVSHELRTPITNIMLYLDLLGHPERQTRREAYMSILLAESSRLSDLIEDLLSLTRLEKETEPPVVEPHVLDALMDEVVSALHAKAEAKRIELNHELNSSIPAAEVHREQIKQLLTNLVGNAVAYGWPETTITLRSWLEILKDSSYVAVSIHNVGDPIPDEDLPQIFERFYRGETGRASGEPGTGLGLAICKEILERHQGWIEVESTSDLGTEFTFYLPLSSS